MTISHGSGTRTALCNTAVDRLDLGGGGAGLGKLKFLTALDVVLCTVTLQNPAFGAASGPTATLLGVPLQSSAATAGTCTKFQLTDSGDGVVIAGTVGTSGQDINLSSVTFATNDIVQIDALTYTAPA